MLAAVLAVLFAAFAALLVLTLSHTGDATRILGRVEAQTQVGHVVTGALALLAAVAAVGLYLGPFWGWWLAGALALEAALHHVLVLVAVPDLSQAVGADPGAAELFILEQLGRSVGWFLVVVALYHPGLTEFFDLFERPRRRTLLLQTVTASLLIFAGSVAWAL